MPVVPPSRRRAQGVVERLMEPQHGCTGGQRSADSAQGWALMATQGCPCWGRGYVRGAWSRLQGLAVFTGAWPCPWYYYQVCSFLMMKHREGAGAAPVAKEARGGEAEGHSPPQPACAGTRMAEGLYPPPPEAWTQTAEPHCPSLPMGFAPWELG